MTDDLDSADQSADNHDTKAHEKSKRGRFKDVLDRTKHKIAERVREEKEARKWSSHSKDQQDGPFDANVAEFLAAGRMNTSSSTHLSVFSDTNSEHGSPHDQSTPPKPSTSDSRTQASPKRVHVPRIDVSASQRFPHAKEIGNSPAELPGSLTTSRGGSLLKPEYKSRSQSTSSIANASRKARIRGLSVGFIDAPPVIIGEGGDEAEAPPVEISRAKTRRAKSASPQGRSLQHAPNDGRRQVGMDQSGDAFNHKPMSRVQTGTLPNTSVVPNTGYDTFVPKPFKRTQTGMMDARNSLISQGAPQLPQMHKPIVPPDLGRSQIVTNHPTRELELSLGLTPTSPAGNLPHQQQEPRIFAPIPQRAPPSYDLIEAGPREDHHRQQSEHAAQPTVPQSVPPQQQSRQHIQQPSIPPSLHESVSQRSTQVNRQQEIPQQVPYPESHRQIPQQLSHQDHRQHVSNVHELPTRQESMASHVPSGMVRRQEQAPHHDHVQQQSQQQPVSQRPMEQIPQHARPQQYRLPEQNFGPRLELAAEQTSQLSAKEHEQMFPEFENFLRSSGLQDQDSPPRSKISRFASLNSPTVRNTSTSPRQFSLPEKGPAKFVENIPNSNTAPLPPIDTSHQQRTHHSPPESSIPSSQPVSRVGSSATGSSHHPTLRRVPPLETYQSSSSNYSSAVTSPQSGAESGSNKMRFYENVNKGNPPAGYI